MSLARAAPGPVGRLALAGGVALAVVLALLLIGQVHAPVDTTTLFGRQGVAAIRLKAQLATAILVLAWRS
jgi:hypothetical protein